MDIKKCKKRINFKICFCTKCFIEPLEKVYLKEDFTGPRKRLRKTTWMEGMSTLDDLNDIVNWSSDEDVLSGSSWSGDDVVCGDSSEDDEENAKQNVAIPQTRNVKSESDFGHEDKYMVRPMPWSCCLTSHTIFSNYARTKNVFLL